MFDYAALKIAVPKKHKTLLLMREPLSLDNYIVWEMHLNLPGRGELWLLLVECREKRLHALIK